MYRFETRYICKCMEKDMYMTGYMYIYVCICKWVYVCKDVFVSVYK